MSTDLLICATASICVSDSKRFISLGTKRFSLSTLCVMIIWIGMSTRYCYKFVCNKYNNWSSAALMILHTTCMEVWLPQRVFGLIIRRLEQALVTITGVCKHGANFIGFASTKLWRVSSAGAVTYSWSSNNTALRLINDCDDMFSGHEYRDTSSNSGKHSVAVSANKQRAG